MALRRPLDIESREKLAELTKNKPEREVRELMGGLSPEAFARAIAGLPIQRGTISLIHTGLAALPGEAA